MHIPDGLVDGRTCAIAGLIALGALTLAVRWVTATIDERQVPMMGLASAFVFAVQMLNFPVASGTSGHLLGGVLAAVLVGPMAGALCVSVVLVVQSLLFADGGVSALGLNVINMSLVGAFGGYVIFAALRAVLPRTRSALVVAAGVAAFLAPVMASIAFTVEYAVGGHGVASVRTIAVAMIGVHVLIGIGEGALTAMTVAAVLASRPDLVHGLRGAVPARSGTRVRGPGATPVQA